MVSDVPLPVPAPPLPAPQEEEDGIDHLFDADHNASTREAVRYLHRQFAHGIDFARVDTLRVLPLDHHATLMFILMSNEHPGWHPEDLLAEGMLGFLSVEFNEPGRVWTRTATRHMANMMHTAVAVLGGQRRLGVAICMETVHPHDQLERSAKYNDDLLHLRSMTFDSAAH